MTDTEASTSPAAGRRATRHRRSGLLLLAVFAGILLVQAAWAIVVPPFRGLDEHDHAYRADSVAHGDWNQQHEASPQGWGSFVRVDADLVEQARPICETFPYTTRDNCVGGGEAGDGRVRVASSAAQYNPAFYWVVGTAARPFSGATELYAMRLAAASLCALLLTIAVATIRVWARSSWPLVGLAAAVTPTMLYSTSLVAPNGVEMCAAAVVWCALLGVARCAGDRRMMGRLLTIATVAAFPLVTVRALGPLWMVLIVVTCAVLVRAATLRDLGRQRGTWIRVGLVGTAAVLGGLWSLTAGTNDFSPDGHYDDPMWQVLPKNLVLWVAQSVGAFPARDEMAPLALYAIALILWWLVLFAAVRAAGRRERAALGLAVLLSAAVPCVITALTYASIGPVWQGRYGYPLAMGVWLISGYALDRKPALLAGFPALRTGRRPLVMVILTIGVTQLIGQFGVLVPQVRKSPLADSDAWIAHPAWLVVLLTCLGTLLLARVGAGRSGQRDEWATQRSSVARAAPESTASRAFAMPSASASSTPPGPAA